MTLCHICGKLMSGRTVRPILDVENEITHLTSLLCVEPEIKGIHEFCETLETYFRITKVAQGSYASVLRMEMITSSSLYTIWKLLPLRPRRGKGSRARDQTRIEDAASEVKALARMQQIHGFVDLRSAQVLRGSLPPLLAKVNQTWASNHPEDAEERVYNEDQLWLVLEMTDAGTDLETILKHGFPDGTLLNKADPGSRLTIHQTWDIFWGVCEALSRGERLSQFEHRDLHPGNVCVTKSRTLTNKADCDEVKRHTNLQITLIDYTLSRATLENGDVLSNSMEDPALFNQTSTDPTDVRQYETYRVMENVVVVRVPESKTGRRDAASYWKQFVPVTNVFWLSHLLRLLLDETENFTFDPSVAEMRMKFITLTVTEQAMASTKFSTLTTEEQEMASTLVTLLNHLRPNDPYWWHYLSTMEVMDYRMGRLDWPFAAYVEGESQAMAKERQARVDSWGGRS